MSEVVHRGPAQLPDADVRGLAVYFAEMANATGRISDDEIIAATTIQTAPAGSAEDGEGGPPRLYTSACAVCHYNRPGTLLATRPELALNSAVTGPDLATLIRLVVQGVGTTDGHPAAYMRLRAGIEGPRDRARLSIDTFVQSTPLRL